MRPANLPAGGEARSLEAAVDSEVRAGYRASRRSDEIYDRRGDLVGRDQPSERLPGTESSGSDDGILRVLQ
jgi:hypothetical protein